MTVRVDIAVPVFLRFWLVAALQIEGGTDRFLQLGQEFRKLLPVFDGDLFKKMIEHQDMVGYRLVDQRKTLRSQLGVDDTPIPVVANTAQQSVSLEAIHPEGHAACRDHRRLGKAARSFSVWCSRAAQVGEHVKGGVAQTEGAVNLRLRFSLEGEDPCDTSEDRHRGRVQVGPFPAPLGNDLGHNVAVGSGSITGSTNLASRGCRGAAGVAFGRNTIKARSHRFKILNHSGKDTRIERNTVMGKSRGGPHQSREWPPPPYELQLARTLEEIYSQGTYELDEVVAALNETSLASPLGSAWSAESFVSALARLGE